MCSVLGAGPDRTMICLNCCAACWCQSERRPSITGAPACWNWQISMIVIRWCQTMQRAESEEAQAQAFNGWGTRLLALADQYERYRQEFEADAKECLDDGGGLVRHKRKSWQRWNRLLIGNTFISYIHCHCTTQTNKVGSSCSHLLHKIPTFVISSSLGSYWFNKSSPSIHHTSISSQLRLFRCWGTYQRSYTPLASQRVCLPMVCKTFDMYLNTRGVQICELSASDYVNLIFNVGWLYWVYSANHYWSLLLTKLLLFVFVVQLLIHACRTSTSCTLAPTWTCAHSLDPWSRCLAQPNLWSWTHTYTSGFNAFICTFRPFRSNKTSLPIQPATTLFAMLFWALAALWLSHSILHSVAMYILVQMCDSVPLLTVFCLFGWQTHIQCKGVWRAA